MAKKNSKRREWTKTDIRELKTLARGKTPVQVKLPGHSREPKGLLVRRRLAWEFPWILVADCRRLADQVCFTRRTTIPDLLAPEAPTAVGPAVSPLAWF